MKALLPESNERKAARLARLQGADPEVAILLSEDLPRGVRSFVPDLSHLIERSFESKELSCEGARQAMR